jgi:hypothetical protein
MLNVLYWLVIIFIAKKAPGKPVESIKPRLRAEFEEFHKLLAAMILEQKVNKSDKYSLGKTSWLTCLYIYRVTPVMLHLLIN